jgi:hypothetical protein
VEWQEAHRTLDRLAGDRFLKRNPRRRGVPRARAAPRNQVKASCGTCADNGFSNAPAARRSRVENAQHARQ